MSRNDGLTDHGCMSHKAFTDRSDGRRGIGKKVELNNFSSAACLRLRIEFLPKVIKFFGF